MKLVRKGTEAIVSGTTARPSTYKIAATPLSFKILSDGLYNDKILACIRELCCNAADAHIAARKKRTPFELHLPTLLEPHFSVKDYGTGMSHKAVRKLYSGYFCSNRSESDEFTGAMGLGSKAPFCYTEGFTVVSRFIRKNKFRTRGIVATYSMFMEKVKDGVLPRWVLLHFRPMEEGETIGLEVSFPCKEQDIQEFENRAKIALEFFDPRPNINLEKFIVPKTEYVIKGEGWALRKNAHTHQTSRVRAIQGMVQYNAGAIDQSRMNPEQKIVAELPLDLFFNIGEISVTASRESLSNEEETIDLILKRLFEVHDNTVTTAKENLQNCATEWDARLYLWNLENSSPGPIIKAAFGRGEFGSGAKFSLKKKLRLCELDFRVLQVSYFYRNFGKWATKTGIFQKKEKDTRLALINKPDVNQEDHTKTFDVEPNMQFWIADLKRGGEKFLHRYVQSRSDNKGCYLFSKIDADVSDDEFQKELKIAMTALGNPPVRHLSTLAADPRFTDPKADPKNPGTYERRNIVYLDTKDSNAWTRCWKKATDLMINEPGKKYYVNLQRLVPVYTDKDGKTVKHQFSSTHHMQKIMDAAFGSRLLKDSSSQRIFGLKARTMRLKSHPDWIELVPFIKATVPTITNPTIETSMSLILNSHNYKLWMLCKHAEKKQLFAADHPIMVFYREWRMLERASKNAKLKALYQLFEYVERKPKGLVNLDKRWETRILSLYPMLSLGYSSAYSDTDEIKAVISYIKLVDAAAKKPVPMAVAEKEISNVATV